jgi:enoyl-CoA hydratase/carnithine racemase
MQLIHEIPQPVIAQVQGIATAAGCQLAAWCDLVIASEDAKFSTPGVKIGLFCTTPMVAVSRAIGRKMAMEMLLTGRDFPAREGFYAQVDQIDDKALHYAKHTIVMNNLSEDAQDGIKAFLEKKPAVKWQDR